MGLSDREKEHIKRLTAQEKSKCEDLTRAFAADLIGAKVERDGQVTGWRRFMDGLHPEAQKIVENHYQWVNAKVVLRGEDETAVLGRGVASCKHALATFRPTPTFVAEPSEIRTMMSGLGKGLGWAPDASLASEEASSE